MSIVSAVSRAAWDVSKSVVVPIKRQFGYVMSSKSYVRDLQTEVENLRDTVERVSNSVEVARNNLRPVSSDARKWLANAEQALKAADDLLVDYEKGNKTCCRGTLPDLNCRYQFSRNAKDKIQVIRDLPPPPPECRGITEIKRHSEYVISSEIYAQDLRKEVGKLAYEVDWVDLALEEAKKDHRNVRSRVTQWQVKAKDANEEASDLLDHFEKASKTWCLGTLPNPSCHYKFSRKAEDKIRGIQEHTRSCSAYTKLEDMCSSARPGYVSPTPAREEGTDVVQSTTAIEPPISASTSITIRDDSVFESRALMIQKVMDALANTSNSVVGIYGMGGVGKSCLLVDVEKRIRIREDTSFDWVARADVSENPDIKRIQGEIAHWLGLTDLEKRDDVSLRANLLRSRLEMEEREKKKVLIILDNLWDRLDLDKVGIPCGPDNKARGCKLLLTARDQRVLRREMRCDSAFLLRELENVEAKRLFEKMVGGKVPVELEPLVEEAVRISAGLPFLIVAISKLFIDTSYSECDYALKQIWSEDTGNVITSTLQLSCYGRISEEAKSLLRLCVAYGVSKPSLEDLARYGFGLRIFRGVSSVQEARVRLGSLIHTLQASSLLLDGEEDAGGFKIHDLVREFVASFASTNRPLLVLKDQHKWETALLEDRLKICEAICFPYVDLEELPKELICPELRIFLLLENKRSLEISDSYFNSMKNLMALDLRGIRLSRSPSPFQFMENLHTLCVDNCSVEDVSVLGKLKGLQILSLQQSDIQQLPKEIGQLVELRLLDLDYCSKLQIIEPGVLGRLTKLEELYMKDSFDRWSAGEQTPATNAGLIELNNMKNLRTLHVSIRNPSALPRDLDVEKLTEYKIRIGDVRGWGDYKGSRMLELNLDGTSDVLRKECFQSILAKADNLYLYEVDRTEKSISALSSEGFPKLKHIQVEDSPSFRCILERSSLPTFEALETLLLNNLVNLEKILCTKNISIGSFSTLKVVRVKGCDKIEVLFPRSVVRELPQLEEIEVVGCKLMRGIVEADGDRGKFELPKLRVLKLYWLPNIENFITTGSSPSRSTSDDQIGTQIAFFNEQQTLDVHGLDNHGFMFSPSMVKSLAKPRKLSIWRCEKMEAIITEEEGFGVEISETLAFPMLAYLSLQYLKSLKCFSHGSREARSQDNVQSRRLALFNREVSFPFLESLTIERLPNLNEIWSDESPLESSNLRSLKVVRCDSLSKVISSRSLVKLHKLQTLSINDCSLVQEIFYLEGPSANGDVETLSELTTLELNKLGSLRCIWNKNPSGIVSFHKLKKFELDGHDNLEFIFFPSMVKSLAQLRDLTVSNCEMMETIIAEEEGLGMEISKTSAFSMLTNLRLSCLESLKCFSRRKCSRETQSPNRVKSCCSTLFSQEAIEKTIERKASSKVQEFGGSLTLS
ncbi:probable disease resistance protein At4g27220 [Rhodamnia argentea]|uniref:Probable disease resistance protein At4g27220 n=1 Tax=Rhodamnia argentea TaxID=178133 RepID=A0ABM3HGH2_9MYRT|nr:probable disease resistance protein At4g27220 [Rhodamnia argentea]